LKKWYSRGKSDGFSLFDNESGLLADMYSAWYACAMYIETECVCFAV